MCAEPVAAQPLRSALQTEGASSRQLHSGCHGDVSRHEPLPKAALLALSPFSLDPASSHLLGCGVSPHLSHCALGTGPRATYTSRTTDHGLFIVDQNPENHRHCSSSRVGVYVHVCFRQFRTCGVRNVLRTNTDFVLGSCSCSMILHVRNDRTHVTFLLQSEGGERTRRKNTSGGVRSFFTTEFELFKVNCTQSARYVLRT